MAKKKTLESFNNGCTFEKYLDKANYYVEDFRSYNRTNTLNKMVGATTDGYKFFKNFQETHSKREKPGFLSKIFNTKYNQLYNKEQEQLDLMRSDLYKLGVPLEMLVQSHKMNMNTDQYEIKRGVDDVLAGLYNGNYSLRCDRWRNGVERIKTEDGKTISFLTKDIQEYERVEEPQEVEPMDLSNEFEVVDKDEIINKMEEEKQLENDQVLNK